VKDRMATRLADWARVAAENHIKLAVKCHVGSAADRPEKLIWLLDSVRDPALTGIYDYSHFQLLGLDMEKTLRQLLPRSAFITVKDGTRVNGAPKFLLPGEGTIDYKRYFKIVREMKWKGWVLVEVSSQISSAPGYEPVPAAEKSYRHLRGLM
jgi:sugar phosphate isomerase/epimerase